MVMEELGRLDDSAGVYKLIGPALVKQDPAEAKANVTKRLDYIRGEMERVDKQVKALQEKGAARQQEVGRGPSERASGRGRFSPLLVFFPSVRLLLERIDSNGR